MWLSQSPKEMPAFGGIFHHLCFVPEYFDCPLLSSTAFRELGTMWYDYINLQKKIKWDQSSHSKILAGIPEKRCKEKISSWWRDFLRGGGGLEPHLSSLSLSFFVYPAPTWVLLIAHSLSPPSIMVASFCPGEARQHYCPSGSCLLLGEGEGVEGEEKSLKLPVEVEMHNPQILGSKMVLVFCKCYNSSI